MQWCLINDLPDSTWRPLGNQLLSDELRSTSYLKSFCHPPTTDQYCSAFPPEIKTIKTSYDKVINLLKITLFKGWHISMRVKIHIIFSRQIPSIPWLHLDRGRARCWLRRAKRLLIPHKLSDSWSGSRPELFHVKTSV